MISNLLVLFGSLQTISAEVAIIGGGFAGLSAAIELQKNGVPYQLLEATSRLGGRVYPIQTEDGQWLQMGAEFINGQDNEIYKMAKELDLLDRLNDYDVSFEEMSFGTGRNRINRTAVDLFAEFAEEVNSKLEKAAETTPELSVEEFYNKEYLAFLIKNTGSKQTFDALSDIFKTQIQNEWSGSVKELALANFNQWDDGSKKDTEWILKDDGYRAILETLKAQVQAKNVKINTRVTNIDWSGDKVLVTAVDSTPVSFDSVIVTLPLGVLKKSPKLFTPALPKEKQDAIKNLGFGSLQKIFLEYSTAWWSGNASALVTPYSSQNNILGSQIKMFEVFDYRNNTLVLFLSGSGPQETAGTSSKEIGAVITNHLKTAFLDNSIPEPKIVYTFNWNADPLWNGAYSFISTNGYQKSVDSFNVLASPLTKNGRPFVLFAGEHTHSKMYQTTVGAYESGKREAVKVSR